MWQPPTPSAPMQRVMPTWGGALTWGALTCEGGGAWNRGGSCHAFQSARGWQLVHINILDYSTANSTTRVSTTTSIEDYHLP